jgi:ribulose-bisphosphate carboxylase small chain
MHLTQGTFSFLPDLTDEQIAAQLRYALRQGWAVMLEYTYDPHPRNALWEMWDAPRFDLAEADADAVVADVGAVRRAHPRAYVKVVCYDRSLGRQTTALAFIVGRPPAEPGFALERSGGPDRRITYTLRSREELAPCPPRS